MNETMVIKETTEMVRSKLMNESTGHDWYHIERVINQARFIGRKEGANMFIVTMAALLHDLVDDKVVSNVKESLDEISVWLTSRDISQEIIEHILRIICSISFKGGHFADLDSLEAKVVQDADRLDAIGAIGIARCFVYAGHQGDPIYDPNIKVREVMSVSEYRDDPSTAINHFYEKLLKLKDLMQTKTGYKLAKERHQFMEGFLEQFYLEIDKN